MFIDPNSNYRYLHGNTPEFSKALANFQLDYSMMSYTDYFKALQAPDCFPYFNVHFTYKSQSASLHSLEAWFDYQFGENKLDIIKQINDVIFFNAGKKHCLWFWGESGSGKSFVLNSLTTLFLNVGFVGNLEPKGDFCYSDVPNKRVIIMDEPTIPENCHNEFKNFFAGQPVSCNIKHRKPELSGKSFWIMLSNNDDVFDMDDPIWKCRIDRLPHLRHLDAEFMKLHADDEKHIHPLAWLNLFKRYNLRH